MQLYALAALALLVPQSPSPEAAPPPKAKEVQAEKPKPYNETADAKADIAAALARAKAENRRVLIQWGGNWCGWCIKLHDLCKSDKDLSRKLMYEYDVVHVDIGKWDKHMDLAEKYGANLKAGVPFLTVLDADGKVLANQETGELEIKEPPSHDPAKVLAFLTRHQAPYQDAGLLLAAAQAQAAKEGKQVLLKFGAPWCGYCHLLDRWMAQPEPKALLAKDFVIRKIDNDRMIGGQELYAKYRPENDGIPWFCVIDAEGKVLASSVNAKNENIGCPILDEEIQVFGQLLTKVAKHLSADEIAQLQSSLVERRKRDEAEAAKKKQKQS